jgi:hypothetical protein
MHTVYILVVSTSVVQLAFQVNIKANQGLSPLGGPLTFVKNGVPYFAQAMVCTAEGLESVYAKGRWHDIASQLCSTFTTLNVRETSTARFPEGSVVALPGSGLSIAEDKEFSLFELHQLVNVSELRLLSF